MHCTYLLTLSKFQVGSDFRLQSKASLHWEECRGVVKLEVWPLGVGFWVLTVKRGKVRYQVEIYAS